MKIFTIGFTGTTARDFFGRLLAAGVKTLFDTRLNNASQLAGFAKRGDIEFFAEKLSGAQYKSAASLAPTKDILDAYRKKQIDWPTYEARYLSLLAERKVEKAFASGELESGCFLCSEAKPHRCHRRLAAEYLKREFRDIEIVHL